MDYKRKLLLKSKSLQRLCKDLKYYEAELEQYQTKRADTTLDDETHRLTDKFILETTRTIESVQSSIETMLDEFEETVKLYLEQFRDQPDILDNCESFLLAKQVYSTMNDYGIEVDMSIFE